MSRTLISGRPCRRLPMLDVGDLVPDFTLRLAFADGRRAPVSFHSLLADGPVVISFYPLAFTGVCTTQVCELRDAQETLASLRATVVGFSIDSYAANVQFARLQDLPYGLYCDPNREVAPRIWEMQTVVGIHNVTKRGWLLVDRDGRVAARWVTDDPEEWSGLKPIEDALQKLS